MDIKFSIENIISIVIGITGLLSAIGVMLRGRSESRKLLSDATKASAEARKIDTEGRKVEVEIAEKFITSAGELIGTYKDMLDNFTTKYAELERKLAKLQEGLDNEINKRRNIERITLEIYHGVKILLSQQEKAKVEPEWKPNNKLERELRQLESSEVGD